MELNRPVGWSLFGSVWLLAFVGMLIDTLSRGGSRLLSVLIYLLMGWLVLFALDDIIAA